MRRTASSAPWEGCAKALASGFFLSYIPVFICRSRVIPPGWKTRWTGAGLVGSLWAVAALRFLPRDAWRGLFVILGALFVAVVVSDYAEEAYAQRDDSRIVIDEFVGAWITLAFQPRTVGIVMTGFVLFRLFDVFKLPWVRRAGELPGGWGVVLDDVMAGILANVSLRVVKWIFL